jgi:hypothetical protein
MLFSKFSTCSCWGLKYWIKYFVFHQKLPTENDKFMFAQINNENSFLMTWSPPPPPKQKKCLVTKITNFSTFRKVKHC